MEAEETSPPLQQPGRAMALATWLRGTRMACHLLYALLLATFYPMLSLSARQSVMQRWSRTLLDILGVRVEINGCPPQPEQGALLVANHVSWLDVPVLNAAIPSNFVAKAEVRSWPLVGLLCRRAGTIFIERNVRRDTVHTNRAISARLAEGERVALFPEGTTTDGLQVRPFHASLLQCAVDAECAMHPIAIRYHDGAGNYSAAAAFIGDMTFLQSLKQILSTRVLHATVLFLPALSGAGTGRRELATDAHAAIAAALVGPLQHNAAAAEPQEAEAMCGTDGDGVELISLR